MDYMPRTIMIISMVRKKKQRSYKDGKLDGKYTSWHENGQIESEGNCVDGEQDGKYTWWHENGNRGVCEPFSMPKELHK